MEHCTLLPDSSAQCTPLAWYEKTRLRDGFIDDAAQAAAIEQLDQLWYALVDFKSKRNRFLGHSWRSPAVPRGLYLWGGVGRGKSFLMDAFFSCVPYERKRRVHFHRFMAEVHTMMQTLRSAVDPLKKVADRIAQATRLLCFDEFHVSDIADAMILSRLLQALFERGVIMVLTSNYSPDDLYMNGLQHDRFLPAIEQLKRYLTVINVDGGHDYRLRELTGEPLFRVPADEASDSDMNAMFDRLTRGVDVLPNTLTVLGRQLHAQRRAQGVVWFDFQAICGGPRAQTDYLELARDYATIFISSIPQLSEKEAAEARRFTWLIDVLYDHRVKLIASAAVEPNALYLAGEHANEFFRTASRLNEMQSTSYLALPHLVDPFQWDPSRAATVF